MGYFFLLHLAQTDSQKRIDHQNDIVLFWNVLHHQISTKVYFNFRDGSWIVNFFFLFVFLLQTLYLIPTICCWASPVSVCSDLRELKDMSARRQWELCIGNGWNGILTTSWRYPTPPPPPSQEKYILILRNSNTLTKLLTTFSIFFFN